MWEKAWFRAYSSTAEQGTHNPLVAGSNPAGPNPVFFLVILTFPWKFQGLSSYLVGFVIRSHRFAGVAWFCFAGAVWVISRVYIPKAACSRRFRAALPCHHVAMPLTASAC